MQNLGFDAMICTGQKSASHFREAGFKTEVVFKGFDERFFFNKSHARQGICHYGNSYAARKAMLRTLKSSGVQIESVAASYERLNHELNMYSSCIVCNMTSQHPLGRIGAQIERVRPGSLLRLQEAPEPMIKNFEAAAAGCCVFMDQIEDLHGLGFVDGLNCVIYSNFDELLEKLDFYQDDPALVGQIGRQGALLVRRRHTWTHRGQDFRRVISGLMDR